MIRNGEIPTSVGTIYTVPQPTPGIPDSGRAFTINLMRVVNESVALRTVTVYLNTNGTRRAITPVNTQLPVGALLLDDFPVFQLPPGATIDAVASGASVMWTINVVQ